MNAAEAKRRFDEAKVLDVSCDTCGATEGEQCRRQSSVIVDPHQSRKNAFEAHRTTLLKLMEWESGT